MSTQTLAPEKGRDADRPALECRVYERLNCGIPTACHPASLLDAKEMRWHGVICDISQGGARLTLPRRFERGTGLAIELPGDANSEPSTVFVKVVHLQAQDDGSWMLGCKFVSELSDDEVNRLTTCGNYVLASTPEEERTETTSDTEAEIMFLTDVCVEIELDGRPVVRCAIKRLDVSKSWPIAAGKTLRINGTAPDRSTWAFEIEVQDLTRHGDGWKLRSRLADSTDAAELLRAIKQYKAAR
jgi:hypothetical protein